MNLIKEIQKTKEVWVVWTNSDLTEGRGQNKVLTICETKATALRLGRKKYIQGSDCPVEKSIALSIKGQWFVPGNIIRPSQEDKKLQEALDKKEIAIQKAKDAGLTDDDLIDLGIKP